VQDKARARALQEAEANPKTHALWLTRRQQTEQQQWQRQRHRFTYMCSGDEYSPCSGDKQQEHNDVDTEYRSEESTSPFSQLSDRIADGNCCRCNHRNVVCVSGSENHRAAGNAPMDLRFCVLRSPCHVGGGREAGMHSNMRVNGFLGMQSEDIHTGA
jgi:hypothetical protein